MGDYELIEELCSVARLQADIIQKQAEVIAQAEIAESVAPGVPVMIPMERPDIRLVLKSGNFGQRDFFLRALERTRKSN